MRKRLPPRQSGAALVEFAIVSIIFGIMLLALLELGLGLFRWNSAIEATRRGARTTAIVAMNDRAAVVDEMKTVFPYIDDIATVHIQYSADGNFPEPGQPGDGCVPGTCRFVRVSLDYTLSSFVFFLPNIPMPRYSTTYPVEVLGNY